MKLLIPVSYFFGKPRSEIWNLDTDSGDRQCLMTLPPSPRNVSGKGITGLTWLNDSLLITCDFNSLAVIDRASGRVVRQYEDEHLNDLHHVYVHNEYIYATNTGRDSIDIFDSQLRQVDRVDALSNEEWDSRRNGNYDVQGHYYDQPDTGLPFFMRKVPDKWHFNHSLCSPQIASGRIVATCFSRRQLLDARTLEPLSNELPDYPHDGFVTENAIWLTTVTGRIYRAELRLPFEFSCVLDLFQYAQKRGWCRGLMIKGRNLFVGITAIYERNSRTAWLDVPAEETASGIYQIDLETLGIQHFYDFTSNEGSRIFSIAGDF